MPKYQPYYRNSHALIIGIDQYDDPGFSELQHAEDDAHQFADILSASPYQFRVTRLIGQDATRAAILRALARLRDTQADDRVLVYFSGHGDRFTDNFSSEVGYLAAADTFLSQPDTKLLLREVTDLRRYAGAKHIAFIFDACYSGEALGLTRHKGPANTVSSDKFLKQKAYQALSAGTELVDDHHSMTQYLIQGLRESSTDVKTGVYTFSHLAIEVRDEIAALTEKTQVPVFGPLRGGGSGDLILRWAGGPRLQSEDEPSRERAGLSESHVAKTLSGQATRRATQLKQMLIGAAIVVFVVAAIALGFILSSPWRGSGASSLPTVPILSGAPTEASNINLTQGVEQPANSGEIEEENGQIPLPVVFGSCPTNPVMSALRTKYDFVVWVATEQDTASAIINCFGISKLRLADVDELDTNLGLRPDLGYLVPLNSRNDGALGGAYKFFRSYLDDAFHVALGIPMGGSHNQDGPEAGYYQQFTGDLMAIVGNSAGNKELCNDTGYPDEILSVSSAGQGQVTIALVVDLLCGLGGARYARPFLVEGALTNSPGGFQIARQICVQELEKSALLRAQKPTAKMTKTQCFAVIPN